MTITILTIIFRAGTAETQTFVKETPLTQLENIFLGYTNNNEAMTYFYQLLTNDISISEIIEHLSNIDLKFSKFNIENFDRYCWKIFNIEDLDNLNTILRNNKCNVYYCSAD